jgi:membrane associated rhomboid family serine protease
LLKKVFRPSARSLHCPVCASGMSQVQYGTGVYHLCDTHGVWTNLKFFSRFKSAHWIGREIVSSRKHLVTASDKPLSCPACHHTMVVTALAKPAQLQIDQCLYCNGVWFDTGEMNRIPDKEELEEEFPEVETNRSSPVEGKELMQWPSQHAGPGPTGFHPLMILGLPVEENDGKAPAFPIATSLIILACIAMTIRAFREPGYMTAGAYLPKEPFRFHGVTLLTSVFLHANVWHLIGNAYFLFLAGDNVEELEGPVFLFSLFLISALAGSFAYSFGGGIEPSIGASGGVAGVLAYYAFTFPKNRIKLGYFSFYRFFAFTMTAPQALGLFIALQIFGGWKQLGGFGGHTNYLAHLGGLAVGLLAYGSVGRRVS